MDKEKRKQYLKEWRKKNPDYYENYTYHYYKPRWMKTLLYIKSRCNSGKYFRKGIKNFLTPKQITRLWIRDKAWLLEKPSIDRIDSSKHYTLENCRFIELKENCRQGGLKTQKLNRERKERENNGQKEADN